MICRVLFALILWAARGCHGAWAQPFPVTIEPNGDHRYPDVVSWEGYDCAALPTSSIAGALGHCKNCLAGSDPAVCGGRGCNIERIADNTGALRWRCVAGTPCPGAMSCTPPAVQTGVDANCQPVCSAPICTFMECPPPTVVIGHDPSCGDICSSDFCTPNPCVNGGQCFLQGNGFVCICPCNCSGTFCQTCVTTTTTSTTLGSTTTGTGSTSSTTTVPTTTTTLPQPVFPSTTFLFEPTYPSDQVAMDFSLVPPGPDNFHNLMVCARAREQIGMANATKLAGILATSCSFPFRNIVYGIFPDSDGGTRLASFNADCSSAAGIVSATGLPAFSLTVGSMYRYCVCNNSAGGGAVGAYGATKWITNGMASEANAVSVTVGTAANPCASAVMPMSTGAITPNNALLAPEMFISRE